MATVDKSTKNYSTFDPRYIPNCVLWLDGADTSSNSMTISSGNVTRLFDKTANRYEFTPNAGQTAPLVSAGLNGKSYINLAASARLISTGTLFSWRSQCTVFFMLKSTAGKFQYIDGNGCQIYTFNNPLFYFTNNVSQSISLYDSVASTNTSVIPTNQWVIFCIGYANGSALSHYTINGTVNSSTTGTAITDFNSSATLYINQSGLDAVSIGEIVHYNRILTITERRQVEGYLGYKWGLSSNLPNTHPYSPSKSPIVIAPSLSPFSPNNISGCTYWIDASDKYYFTLDGSSNVTSITNKSALTFAPTLYGTITWSKDGLATNYPAFDTNSGALVTPALGLTNFTNTTFIVTKLTSDPPAGSTAVGLSTSATGSSTFYRALDYASATYRTVLFSGTAYPTTVSSNVGNSFLFTSSYSGSSSTINNYLNGGSLTSSRSSTTVTASSAFAMIGCDSFTFNTIPTTAPVSYWANGKISEVIIFNSVLSDNDRNTVEGYLAWKWNLQGNLPSTHIYKKYYPLTIG